MQFTARMLIQLQDDFVTTHYNGDHAKMRQEFMEALQECLETYGQVKVVAMETWVENG